jgi:D-glycero-D-manno-heptose 1,7-bisphosphate phosphatase
MLEDVRRAGGAIAAIHVCYHAPEDGCDCRKPAPGLLLRAAREHALDLARVVLVGDDRRDLEAARAAGAVPVLVRTGKGRQVEEELRRAPPHPASPPLRGGEETRGLAIHDDLLAFVRSLFST